MWIFFIAKALPSLLIIGVGLFAVMKCSSLLDTYNEVREENKQRAKKEKAKKESEEIRREDYKRIHELKNQELTIEEKHRLLQEIGTK